MLWWSVAPWSLLLLSGHVLAQQQCYYGAGGSFRGPKELVPCNATGTSACCLLGDTCLSGNTCYSPSTGNLYQYGCTDITYQDDACPYKCGFDPTKSPWTALEYCNDVQDLSDTWICHGPESCGCEWQSSQSMLVLAPRGCKDMGSDALVALYAPSTLAPYVSLPSTYGGSTGYYKPTLSDGTSTWVETAIPGYTPDPITQLTTYRAAPTTSVWVDQKAIPGPSTYASAKSWTGSAPGLSDGASTGTASQTNPPTGTSSLSLVTNTSPSSGLSTGSKVGIGVGVAGGVCLIAATAIALFLMNRRHKKQQALTAQQQQQQSAGPPQSPYMRQAPPYPQYPPNMQQNPSWQPYHPGVSMPEPFFTYQHHDVDSPHTDISAMASQRQTKSSTSQDVTAPPTELPVDETRMAHEMESLASGMSPRMSTKSSPNPTPAPRYSEREGEMF